MNKIFKSITTAFLAIMMLFTMAVPAFAQTKTLSYKSSGGEIVGVATVKFKNNGLVQTNKITITNNSNKQIYVLIDGCGYYIKANQSYSFSYKAWFGVTTTTTIKIQSCYKDLNWSKVSITTSSKGTVEFSNTIKGSKIA